MKVLVASDKFKGSLSALEACNAIREGVWRFFPNAEIVSLPLADGGEGTLVAINTQIKFDKIEVIVNNPLFQPIKAYYGIKDKIAYIEMALASGLLLLKKETYHAPSTTTLGTGELILDALEKGVEKIFLFIGGSATNDAGIGMAHALGYRFYNKNNIILQPVGASLIHISSIGGKPNKKIAETEFILVNDVKNPLYGSKGAAKVYAKQKGASIAEIEMLNAGLKNFSKLVKKQLHKDIAKIPGSGAAGGMGAGAMIFLNAQMQNGIDTIMDILDIDNLIKDVDYVISGEGKFDRQTMDGKVIKGIMDKCCSFGKVLGIICGISELNPKEIKKLPVKKILSIKNKKMSVDFAMKFAYILLVQRAEKLMEFLSYK